MSLKNQAVLPEETAAQMLENIFRTCKKTPNTVPLSTLRAYSNYRKERFALQRTVIFVILTLFALMPLLFIAGDFTITAENAQGTINPRFHVKPASLLPIRHVSVQIDGITQPVYEDEDGTYIIQPSMEGQMKVSLTLINRQTTTKTVPVDQVDYTKPHVKQHRKTSNAIMLYLDDEGSGINGAGISVTDIAGQSLSFQFDTDKNCLIVPFTKGSLNIFVPDKCGNMLELNLLLE